MVETQQLDDEQLAGGGYPDDGGYGPFIQDSDILDQPELFYGQPPGASPPFAGCSYISNSVLSKRSRY